MRGVRRLGLMGLLLIAAACSAERTPTRQFVLLAVDGLDPAVLSTLLAEDRLPHLAALARTSGVVRVTPTPGAESASAWASFVTGTGPGVHGVFDLVAPDPWNGRPRAATLEGRPSSRWFADLWREGAVYAPVRGGTPFWTTLGQAGVRSRVLFMPGTFPPEPVPSGSLVSGTPLPDWGGGWGAGYTWLASDVAPDQVGYTRYGGRRERLSFTRNVAHATIVGLRIPIRVDVPLTVAWSPEERSANIIIGDETVHLNEGQQSRWVVISAGLSPITRVQGMVRLHLVRAGQDVQVYVSPIQWHPAAPPSPMSSPSTAAAALFGRLGPFRTLAWPDAGWAFADGVLTEAAFIAAAEETFDDRAAALLNQAESGGWELLAVGIETLGTTSRLLWRGSGADDRAAGAGTHDAVVRAYERLDTLVGDLRARLPPEAAVAVVSAYGLARVRRVVDLNRWLTDHHWLAWRETPPPVTLAAMADPAAWPDHVDWSRTAARAMGAGHVYVNLRGREPWGVVQPGSAYDALLADLRRQLEALTDPATGARVAERVRTAKEVYSGPDLSRAPDLLVAFAEGFGGSWDTALGGAAPEVVAPNGERWRAAHAGLDERRVPGVWLSSVPVAADTIAVVDIAPTILAWFGHLAPPEIEGRAQLRAIASNTSRR